MLPVSSREEDCDRLFDDDILAVGAQSGFGDRSDNDGHEVSGVEKRGSGFLHGFRCDFPDAVRIVGEVPETQIISFDIQEKRRDPVVRIHAERKLPQNIVSGRFDLPGGDRLRFHVAQKFLGKSEDFFGIGSECLKDNKEWACVSFGVKSAVNVIDQAVFLANHMI